MRYSTIEIFQIISALLIGTIGLVLIASEIYKMIKTKKLSYRIIIIVILTITSVALITYTFITMNTLYNTWVLLNWLTLLLEGVCIIFVIYLLFFDYKKIKD
ncbi:hypothetical protein EMELA_v1c07630 [Mesoplasma melaleucae]|uniref:Uncharacterized protein n=1 Tax=Mesoplasma melaleucae TaxID=81459 RepID=A0A2K8NWN7_9MOLU|nr:hypothetical protein [Mesoplasma melaleucae]ATZ18250.1 hypothetical protein EMELA_v1c07630 [Mesoplasma melaleucae]